MKNVIKIITAFATVILFSTSSFAVTGNASIENVQVAGPVFSFELHFMRTDEWSPGLLTNALGGSDASFDFNTGALANPTVVVEPGGPLDNANYNITVQIIIDKLIVDIPFMLNELAGTLPLNVNTKLLTVYMDITDPNQTSQLSWDALNTGFFDNTDATVITTLLGGNNDPLPVELTSFNAEFRNQSVDLNWETKTEVNYYGFEIEKSSVGNEQSAEWTKIGFIAGSGNSNSPKKYSYKDNDLFNSNGNSKFQYRLKQVDNDGTFKYTDVVEVEVVPNQFELSQNYPNPFNPTTTIRFSLPKQTELRINVYNILGELVETIAKGVYEAGYYKTEFNASNLPSGTYIYRIESNDFIETNKDVTY